MKELPTFGSVELDDRKEMMVLQSNADFAGIESRLSLLPPSRLSAIAMTKLEEASMWVNKAISRSE